MFVYSTSLVAMLLGDFDFSSRNLEIVQTFFVVEVASFPPIFLPKGRSYMMRSKLEKLPNFAPG
jgi:hypothetical protein